MRSQSATETGADATIAKSRLDSALTFAALTGFAIFFALSFGYVFTRRPWWDEGLFADVAIHFRNFGRFGSCLLASHGYQNMPAVDRYTYWQFPLYLLSLGLWFHIAPVCVQSMRVFSLCWACAYVTAWFLFVLGIARNRHLAMFVAGIIAIDYSVLAAASDGRMEMMCAALGLMALAAYVCLRDTHYEFALLLAGLFGAASLFCHPMGAVMNLLLAAIVLRDCRRLSPGSFTLAAIPYMIGGALCLRYVLKAPEIFLAQSRGSAYRINGLKATILNVCNDLETRYLPYYFTRQSGLNDVKIFALAFGVAGFLAVLLRPQLRAHPLAKAIYPLVPLAYLAIAALDNRKFPYYLIYVMALLSACAALWVYEQLRSRGRLRVVAVSLAATYAAVSVAGFWIKIRSNEFKHVYEPAVAAVRDALSPGQVADVPSEFGFELAFGPPFVDDCEMGFGSGMSAPGIYVLHEICGPGSAFPGSWQWLRQKLRDDYRVVFSNAVYRVYIRNSVPAVRTGISSRLNTTR